MCAELENDSDDEEQFDDNVQHFMRTKKEEFRDECPHVQDKDSELDFLNGMWIGQQYRQEAQLPHHLELIRFAYNSRRLCKIISTLGFRLQKLLLSSTHPYRFRTGFAKSAHGRDKKAYMTVGCVFHLHVHLLRKSCQPSAILQEVQLV